MWAKRKKRDNYKALQLKVTNLHQQITPKPSEDIQPQKEIDSPDAVLRYLVFPYLDFKDMVQPVCKRWTRIAKCNLLWKSLYQYRFGMPCTRWLTRSTSTTHDWKLLFHSAFVANYNIRGQMNTFGWNIRLCPVLGCNKELRSKLEYDTHVLKHEETYCLNHMKHLNKKRRDQKRLDNMKKKAGKK